jgi:hypothetical protein
MGRQSRSDPTFPIFVVIATAFIFVFVYVTFPRRDAPARTSAAANATVAAPAIKLTPTSPKKRARSPDPIHNVALRLRARVGNKAPASEAGFRLAEPTHGEDQRAERDCDQCYGEMVRRSRFPLYVWRL